MKLRTLSSIGLLIVSTAAVADTKVYDLNAQNAKEIRDSLQSVLAAQCPPINVTGTTSVTYPCQVELLSTGQLLVTAPDAAQAQVAEVLKAIAARNAAPTPRVTLQYWVISGAPGKPDASDPALKPLSAVLQQLEKLHGELGFKVEDSAMLTTQSGTRGRNEGGAFEVDEQVRANGDSVNADVRLKFTRLPIAPPAQGQPFQPLRSELSLSAVIRRGEYLVLGESKFNVPGESGTLFYVVHWPEGQ